MKKTAALVCALLLVLLLPGCTLVQQAGNVAKQAEELPVAECVQAAADGDEDTFLIPNRGEFPRDVRSVRMGRR